MDSEKRLLLVECISTPDQLESRRQRSHF